MKTTSPYNTPEDSREKRIRALFDQAAEMPEHEWEHFLLEQCADDPDLRAHILRILKGSEQANDDGFLNWFGDTEPTDIPQFIGKYQIVRRLSSKHTGQGTAYLALDPDTHRHVVVKRYHDHFDAQATADEARALVRVSSPYVARCYGVERTGEGACLVVEYIPGRSLAEVGANAILTQAHAVRIVSQLGEGVAAVHACGLIHRDVKPANVILHDDGTPRLVDFGLAAHLGSRRLRGLSGSPPYMSPEQARQEWDRIDYRTDVHGLGGVLYELLTGHSPYEGETRDEILEKARAAAVTPPRALKSTVPRALERICLRALAPFPADRYPSADALSRDLDRFTAAPRRRALTAAAALILIGLFVLATVFLPQSPLHRRDAIKSPSALQVGSSSQLDGELTIQVWTPKGNRAKRGLDIAKNGALPVRNSETVHLQALLTRPAYIYLFWIDSQGTVQPLYPWNPKTGFKEKAPPSKAVRVLHSPTALDQGWDVIGPSGLETVMLLARSAPLPDHLNIESLPFALPTVPLTDARERQVWKVTEDRQAAELILAHHRGVDAQRARQIDEPLLTLLEHLRPHFELIYVVRFAHEGT